MARAIAAALDHLAAYARDLDEGQQSLNAGTIRTAEKHARDEHAALLAERDGLRTALEEIAKGEGAFSRDRLTHASNCIESMKAIATAARAKVQL